PDRSIRPPRNRPTRSGSALPRRARCSAGASPRRSRRSRSTCCTPLPPTRGTPPGRPPIASSFLLLSRAGWLGLPPKLLDHAVVRPVPREADGLALHLERLHRGLREVLLQDDELAARVERDRVPGARAKVDDGPP